jgi:hypothetical protein
MKIRKLISILLAAVMCLSLSSVAFAVNGEEESTDEIVTDESTTAEEPTSENVSEEPSPEESTSEENPSEESTEKPSEEESTEKPSEEESTKAPDEDDVISLIISLLGKIDLEEVKDAFNDINEALGLPRIESYTDIPAYADALYGKLEEMGLGYGDIINGLASSDLLDWLNKLIFGGGSSAPSTTAPSEDSSDDFFEEIPDSEESPIPDTGVSFGVVAAAVAAMGGSGALALILRKRDSDEE